MDVAIAVRASDDLGEGPVWDDRTGELVRVDITGRKVHRWSPSSGAVGVREVDGDVGAALLCSGEGLVLAVERELRLNGTVLARAEGDGDVRLNDCRCDPQGRIWAGTMSRSRREGAGALYRLDPDGTFQRMFGGTTISNGLGWSPAGDLLYFIDSPTQRIDVFDFDGATGAIADRRPFAEIDPADGLPDGLAVDSAGAVWVCLFGGGAIRRYTPEGELDRHVALPVTNPTCPAFGDDDLRTIYVTTARHRLTRWQLLRQRAAGAVLALRVETPGQRANRFAGA
jgi:sugar lactone lactonase YvrE